MTKENPDTPVLDDLLFEGVLLVFCGMAVGERSARAGAYYAGRGNVFWRTLHSCGYTKEQIAPTAYRSLERYRIGLTDLIKRLSGNDDRVKATSEDIASLEDRIRTYNPVLFAFNGKKAAQCFFRRKTVEYGLQKECIGSTKVYVLPSTSGSARLWWNEDYWKELADELNRLKHNLPE